MPPHASHTLIHGELAVPAPVSASPSASVAPSAAAPVPLQASPARLPSLTSLRFFFALGVLLCHMAFIPGFFAGAATSPLTMVEPLATGAVSGFFVLSGFVLTWAYVPGERFRSFWRRRFWKIVPNHVLAWSLAVLFFAVTTAVPPTVMHVGDSPGAALASLFLVQTWVPDGGWFFSFNAPAWSISCEAFFYALFPAAFALLRRIPASRLWRAWAAFAAVTLLLPLLATAIPGPPLYDWIPVNRNSVWFIYVFPPVRMVEFCLGILTARLVQAGRWPRMRRVWTGAPVLVMLLVLPFLPIQYTLGMAMAAPLALVVAALALADIEGRSRYLLSPRLITLGEASFALYMIHFPLMLTVRHMLGVERTFTAATGAVIVIGLFVASIALSLVVHRYYELPLMRRWARPRASVGPALAESLALGAPLPDRREQRVFAGHAMSAAASATSNADGPHAARDFTHRPR
ncbi:acyltransferase family protein [Streptomyces sp. NPDC051567]|uniref:acyltransferase family protein n=1 Tax=Streptomyces sp. NPDC051567 TaxID=3365660 RepID=UPI0037B30E2E